MNCRVDGSIAETYTAHHEGETSGFCGAIADHVQLETHASEPTLHEQEPYAESLLGLDIPFTLYRGSAECKEEMITPMFFIALHVFRQYNSWATLVSGSDCLMSVVGPILREVMIVQHEIRFIWTQLQQDGQSRQPDVIGPTRVKAKCPTTNSKGQTHGIRHQYRCPATCKDSLDQLHNVLVKGSPMLTLQTTGQDITFFLAVMIVDG
ncbi:hypothetical protein B0O80DRAFT_280481 [Mortierella sp. GBAus27b]|nr:hypothetical protein B0O80DRAFT_280481 [Mortierella sp. GBAus27b]